MHPNPGGGDAGDASIVTDATPPAQQHSQRKNRSRRNCPDHGVLTEITSLILSSTMDGRDELGDISATPPVAAAFSSSLIEQDEPDRGRRVGRRSLSSLDSGDVEAGEASGQHEAEDQGPRLQSLVRVGGEEEKKLEKNESKADEKDAKGKAWTQGRMADLGMTGFWQWTLASRGPS
ncbi:hypothetical protein TrVFT333_006313 [Trichoderma virens FT-333]|nr:hypothetical protein TrVFT333_006313 [Trichoderma virens FT-333]